MVFYLCRPWINEEEVAVFWTNNLDQVRKFVQCVYAIILLKSNESKWKTNEQNNNACVDKLRTTSESYRNNVKANGAQKIVYKFVHQANKERTKVRRVFSFIILQMAF